MYIPWDEFHQNTTPRQEPQEKQANENWNADRSRIRRKKREAQRHLIREQERRDSYNFD